MKNALILHGTDGTPEKHWFRWLEKELTNLEYTVWLPQLPDSQTPDMAKYVSFLTNHNFDYNPETILVGHSSGAVAILGLLSKLETRVDSVYLVGSFMNSLDWDALNGLFIEPLDFQSIKDKADKFVFIHSDNDPYCPLEHAEYLSKQVNGELVVIKGQGHFNTENNPKYKKFPELLNLIKQI